MARAFNGNDQPVLDELLRATDECRRLLPHLVNLLAAQPGLGPRAGTIGRHAPESREPWATEAASAHWGIHFGSQIAADRMRVSLGIGTLSWGSNNGLDVMDSCAPIIEPILLRNARNTAEGWVNAALRIRDIDQAETWTAVPRTPGLRPPFCPHCHTYSLRLNRRRGEIRCFLPGCVDSDGKPTRARMETGAASGEGMLVFDDNTVMTFRAA